jgi:hypothetical protein
MQSELHKLAFTLAKEATPDEWRKAELATGVKFAWTRAFVEGRIPNPSAVRLEKLIAGLTGKSVSINV